jgi:hypothetical protein
MVCAIENHGKMKVRKTKTSGIDKRRKHHHWQVTVFYSDFPELRIDYLIRLKASSQFA